MREIEIKAKVADKPGLLQALKTAGITLSEPITQHDRVWGLIGVDGGDDSNHAPWLRVRSETKQGKTRYIFTLKKSVTNQLDSIEHETEVSNPEETAKIIEHSGFEPYSDTTKTRQKAQVGDFEVCVDTVEGLGDFIEAEKLTDDDADYNTVVKELWNLLASFGVNRDDEVTEGYDVMSRRKMGLDT